MTSTLTLHEPGASAIVHGIAGWHTSEDPPPQELVGQRLIVVAGPGSVWAHAPFELVPDLHPGCIVGAVTLADVVPIDDDLAPLLAASPLGNEGCIHVNDQDGSLTYWREMSDGVEDWQQDADISDQLPWADWSPGRWAWRFENPKPTTVECPVCGGDGREPGWRCGFGPMVYHIVDCGRPAPRCSVCNGDGTCSPFPYSASEGLAEFDPGRLR